MSTTCLHGSNNTALYLWKLLCQPTVLNGYHENKTWGSQKGFKTASKIDGCHFRVIEAAILNKPYYYLHDLGL